MDKLKPCPFCGRRPTQIDMPRMTWCINLECEMHFREMTVKQWNTRPDSPLTPGTLIGGRKVIAVVDGSIGCFGMMGRGYEAVCDWPADKEEVLDKKDATFIVVEREET